MIPLRPAAVLRIATLVLCILSCGAIGTLLAGRRLSEVYPKGHQFPQLTGYRLDGTLSLGAPDSCRLIRITADYCPYCQQDHEEYERTARHALSLHCQAVEISPRAGQMEPHGTNGIEQIQYIDLRLGRALVPFATPQTIVLDRNGRVIWQQQGAMDSRTAAQARVALTRAGSGGAPAEVATEQQDGGNK